MAPGFPLAGLLRLRRLQQDTAASSLAAVNRRLIETGVRQERARTALGGVPSDPTSTQALYALAASRASMRSMLADLDGIRAEQQQDADTALTAYTQARRRSVSLEKLEQRHDVTVAADERAAEQSAIDEIASTAWHRDREKAAR